MNDFIISTTFKRNKKEILDVLKRIERHNFNFIYKLKFKLNFVFHIPFKIKISNTCLLESNTSIDEFIQNFIIFHGDKETIKKITVWKSNFPISVIKKETIFKQVF